MPSYPLSNLIFSKYRQFFELRRKDYYFNIDIEAGKLLFDRRLVTFRGAHLPLDLHLKYSQNFFDSNNGLNAYTGLPKGFKFNYHVYISIDNGQHNYVDKDGFTHVFALAINSSKLYYDTNGSGLMMETTLSGGFRIFDDDGNYQLFDSDGRLIVIREQISLSHYREIAITYTSLLKIATISDEYGHVIEFDYTNPSQILIKRNNQILFALNVSINQLTSIQRFTSTIDYFSESYDWLTDGFEELELASGEIFNATYNSTKISSFYTNYKQNYYSLVYDVANKRTCIVNARGIETIYDYDQNLLVTHSLANNVDLGYLSLSKDASSYLIKNVVPNNQKIDFNLQTSGQTPVYSNQVIGANSNITTASVSADDIALLAQTYDQYEKGTLEDKKGFCAVVPTSEIAKQDFILTPGRYVGIEEQADDGEPFDAKMKRLTAELSGLFAKSHDLETEIRANLESIGYKVKND